MGLVCATQPKEELKLSHQILHYTFTRNKLRLLFSNYDLDFCGFSSLDATFSARLGRLKNDNPLNKANEKDCR